MESSSNTLKHETSGDTEVHADLEASISSEKVTIDTDGELEPADNTQEEETKERKQKKPATFSSKVNDLKKVKRKQSKVGKTYRSQYMRIGEIHCIFLSCFYRGRSPVLTLGPSWPFTLFLLLLGTLIAGYFTMMIEMGSE